MECFEPVKLSSLGEEEKKPISKKAIAAGGGALCLIILVSIFLGMRTMPPEKVALEWLEACADSNGLRATHYTTEDFEMSAAFAGKRSFEKAEEYTTDRQQTGLTFTPHQAKYNRAKHPTSAVIRVTFHYGKDLDYDRYIYMRRVGRDWKVDEVK